MARQYKRRYDLTVIDSEGNAVVIRELKIEFEVVKSVLSFPNLAKISLYNLSQDTLSLLQTKFTRVILNAGYLGNISLIFKGDIRNVFQSQSGVDSVATIYAADGEKDWQNAIFNKTFTSNVTISEAINEVLNTFKEATIGALEGIPEISENLRGQTLSGSSKDILDNFADEYGFNWNIQDGEVIITPVDQPLTGTEAVLITALTGMLGSPTVTEIGADVTTLLNPKLLPNTAFEIKSINADVELGNVFFRNIKRTNATGLYKVQEVTFKGNSREGEWVSSVKGRVINVG